MADPTGVDVIEGQWNLVVENELTGYLRKPFYKKTGKADAGAFAFFWTSRDYNGGVAVPPDDNDKTDNGLAMPLFEQSRNEEIGFAVVSNIYVWCENPDEDESDTTFIRVDLP